VSRKSTRGQRLTIKQGESGLDGTDLLPPPAVPAVTDIPAIDAMAKAIFATSTGTAWLVATGTLTNIAQLITKYPTIVEHIKGLSIMGGAIGGGFTAAPMGKIGAVERFGNWTPYAGEAVNPRYITLSTNNLIEFNIVCDPEASYAVFSNPVLATKTNLIPLDVTHQVLATQSVQDLLLYGPSRTASPSSPPSQLRVMLIELINFFAETYASVFGITAGPPLHDPLALAVILDGIAGVEMPFYDFIGVNGEKGRNERYAVNIISEGTHAQAVAGETQTGRTVATLLPDGAEGVKIPRSLNVERFWDVLEVCLQRADEKNAVLGVK
jgi:uridine nucleosidase